MTGHTSSVGPTGAGKRSALSLCPKCEKRQEDCADGRTCESWRESLEVCRIFGTRFGYGRPGGRS